MPQQLESTTARQQYDFTATLPPTAVSCPNWCQLPAGHPYEVEDEHGRPGRHHVTAPEGWRDAYAYADVSCLAHWIGGGEFVAQPIIDVVIGGNAHENSISDPETARHLAHTLLAAADKMEAIQ